MNDDYDTHIVQKYRLAVSIAIIKNTPENSTVRTYLEVLRRNIIPEMEPYDSDMTICEDDFNDSDNKDNGKEYQVISDNADNDTQFILDSQSNYSITILKDFDFDNINRNINDMDSMKNNSVTDVLRILKGVDNEEISDKEGFRCDDDNRLNHSQSTYYESSQTLLEETNGYLNENIQLMPINDPEYMNKPRVSQNIINNEVSDNENREQYKNLTGKVPIQDLQRVTYQNYTDNLTHVSQSQDNIIIPKYLIENDKAKTPKDNKTKLLTNKVQNFFNIDVSTNLKNNSEDIEKNKEINGNTIIIINDKTTIKGNKKHKLAPQHDNIETTQNKRNKNICDNRVPNTDAEYFNEIKNKFNISTNTINAVTSNDNKKISDELFMTLFKSDVVSNSLHLSGKLHTECKNSENYYRNNSNNFGATLNRLNNKKTDNSQNFSQFSQEFESDLLNNTKPREITISAKNEVEKEIVSEETEEEQIIEELFDKLTDSQAELVPFKVLEELKKVKSFLRKHNRSGSTEYVPDSGYRSDSQSRSSFKKAAVQSSNISMNQSAQCLLNYISQCPLVVSTEEITNEISKSLGRLIDRLHEEEKYPSFLEEHLDIVNSLLKEIYEEESADKLLKRDENVYRLFLLNKSSHIMKYTTEKIVSILEELHTTLTNEELLEASRTVQTENLSYIFHILETLIKKILVYKNLSQQRTQNSQEEDVVLKRSSIADIWRKKWNPDKKCVGSSGGVKECVLVRCGEVLNKLIVQAMDGYSLISYFALQCFNLLQN